MTIPTRRLDALEPTINPERDHEIAAMRDGISSKLRIEQALSLLQSSDIPDGAVALAKLAGDARAASNITFNDTAAELGETDVQGAIEALAGIDSTPAGAIQFFAMNTAPSGWLKANGAAISRTTYADLFAAIGTTFGPGDGSTTFNLPDLRGEFIRGWDDGRGVDSARTFGSSQSDELKAHRHTFNAQDRVASGSFGYSMSRTDHSAGTNRTGFGDGSINLTGGPETRPRNVALLACIKY